jgi:hypothetical protein
MWATLLQRCPHVQSPAGEIEFSAGYVKEGLLGRGAVRDQRPAFVVENGHDLFDWPFSQPGHLWRLDKGRLGLCSRAYG